MPVELNTLITAVVRAVLDQLDTRPASVALVLAPRDEALARQVEKRLGSAMEVSSAVKGIQDSAQSNIALMDETDASVQQGVELVTQAGEALQEIVTQVMLSFMIRL